MPILILALYFKYKKKGLYFKFLEDLNKVFRYWKIKFFSKFLLLSLTLISFIIILANPNKSNIEKEISKKWIDIVFLLDVSESMNAQDLKPSRIEAAKNILKNFLDKLKNDRVGLVIFSGKPFTSLPLTFDYKVVKEILQNISTDTINQNIEKLQWTAIWDAILMWKNLLTKNNTNKNREKIMILLTDGKSNKWIDPILAAKYVKKYGIKIYTIWIGSKHWGYITYNNWFITQQLRLPPLNEKPLREIAKITWGKFYRATDNYTLEQIFDDLSKLTKTEIKTKIKKTYEPYYTPFTYLLLLLLWIFTYLKIKEI